jgi:flavin-dependent dehydrogenase
MDYDAIIAGGGPAGSSTASYLRLRGRRPLVLERERFPRFHLGESMLPFSTDLFRELGLFDEIDRRYMHKPGARFLHEESGACFTYYFRSAIDPDGRPYSYQVPRADFDKLLLDNSRRLGAEVREETEVRHVRFLDDRVEVQARGPDGAVYTVAAPVFIDATGRDTFLARAEDLKVVDEAITTNVACFTHYRNVKRQPGDDEGNFTLIMFDGGWWWFIPFKGDVTSIGVVFQKEYTLARKGMSPQQLFEGAIAEQRLIKGILDGAERVRPIDTTGNWSYRCKRYHGDRWLLVGDAAAFIDPLFSTGVLMAMMSGKYAAEAVDEALADGRFEAARFAAFAERALAGADLFKKMVHEFYTQNLRRMLVADEQNDSMRAVITSMLAGDVYRPRIWHQLLRRGFSHLMDLKSIPGETMRARTSRAGDKPTTEA